MGWRTGPIQKSLSAGVQSIGWTTARNERTNDDAYYAARQLSCV